MWQRLRKEQVIMQKAHAASSLAVNCHQKHDVRIYSGQRDKQIQKTALRRAVTFSKVTIAVCPVLIFYSPFLCPALDPCKPVLTIM